MLEESRKTRILMVDDEPGFTLLVKMNLEKEGRYVVEVLNDPTLVMDRLSSDHPDLIILDMVMPGIDGGELSSRIRSNPETSEIPVIFLTALVAESEETRAQIAQHGDRVVVGKPVDLKMLVEAIESVLE